MAAAYNLYVFHGLYPGFPIAINAVDSQNVADPNYNASFVCPQGTVRYKQADDSVSNLSNPVPIPSSGYLYSYRKNMKLRWTSAPPAMISNLVWYSSGLPYATGVQLNVAIDPNYQQSGTNLDNGQNDVLSALAGYNNSINYIAGSPLVVNSGGVTTTAGFGVQDFTAQQIQVSPSASDGATSPSPGFSQTFYMVFDEV
jgi:hypothetical protein